MLTLVTFKKDGTRKEIPLEAGDYTVGRNSGADLRIPVDRVSRSHCLLAINGNLVTLRDLGSSNGTFVNDTRITEVALHAGDQITIGPVTFVVQIDGQPENIRPSKPEPASTQAPTKPSADSKTHVDDDLDLDDLSDLDIDDLSDLDLTDVGEAGNIDDAALEFLQDDDSEDDLAGSAS
ncbi:MAG: FHA domain-containing protein [Phycisphaerae bacterium]